MTTINKLKPCPFCGKADFNMVDTLYPTGTTWEFMPEENCNRYAGHGKYKNKCWQVVCDCGAEHHADSKEEVIEAWNNRPGDELKLRMV